jgi:tight adherence protein B
MPLRTWIAGALVFVAVALGTVALAIAWEWLRHRRRQRAVVGHLRQLASEEFSAVAAGGTLFRGEEPTAGRFGSLATRLPHLRSVETMIDQAALSWSVGTYVTMVVGAAFAFGLAVLVATGVLLFALPAAVFGAVMPYVYVRFKQAQRIHRFEEQLPEAVDLLGRAIRAGHPISAGFRMVAEEAPEPISAEFRRVFEEQRFGLPFEESLLGMADRVPLVDVRIFATAVLIQREVGGNLAEILDKLSDVIRQRFSILRQLRVHTAQGRMSGYILASLPLFLGLVLTLMNPENMKAFVDSPLGRVMIVVALVLQTIGFLWIRKIIRIEV